ncbi:hypothetical protein BGX33_001357, partial [Mortierella sp. NVP41]
ADGTVRIWDPSAGGGSIAVFEGKGGPITALAYSPCGKTLAVGYWGNDLEIWDSDTGTHIAHLYGHKDDVTEAAFSPCGRWLASSSQDRTVRLWRVSSNDGSDSTLAAVAVAVVEWPCAYVLRDFLGDVEHIDWKPQGSLEFVTTSDDNSIRMWRFSEDDQGTVYVNQLWGTRNDGIIVSGAIVKDVFGLSKLDRDLLVQRGATDGTTSDSGNSDSVSGKIEGSKSE